jgi:hypothetical protein
MNSEVARKWLTEQVKLSGPLINANLQLIKYMSHPVVVEIRKKSIQWMTDVLSTSRMSDESRDTSIQIYDKFMGLTLEDGSESVLSDVHFWSSAACVCVITASKIHETKPLSAQNFPHFSTEELYEFELVLVSRIGYSILSQGTPTVMIEHLLALLEPHELEQCESIKELTSILVKSLLELPDAVYFSPVTIGITVLLLSFSKLHIDCSAWLRKIPCVCLPQADHPFFNQEEVVFLDADSCIQCLQLRLNDPAVSDVFDSVAEDMCDLSIDTEDNAELVEIDITSRQNRDKLMCSPTDVTVSFSPTDPLSSDSNRDFAFKPI